MPFLQVNGYTIPVASVRRRPLLLGARGRAYDGTPQTQDRGRKMILECKTPPLIEQTREAIIGIIQGDGFVWPFDTAADFYSHKGVGPATGLDQATVQAYLAADGAPVSLMAYLNSGALSNYTPLRNGILSVDPDSTNILAADKRDAEDAPNGYHQFGVAVLAADATHYFEQTKSLKVTSTNANSGAETDTTDPNAPNGTVFCGSVYVKNGEAAANNIKVQLWDFTNGNGSVNVQINVPAGEWVRFAVTHTINGINCRDLELRVYSIDAGKVFYCDAWDIEEQPYPTAWVDGARGGADDLGYDFDFNYSFTDWSAGIWFWGPAAARCPTGANLTLWRMAGAGATAMVYRPSGALDTVSLVVTKANGASVYLNTGAGDVDWETWNFIGVSFRTDPETGESNATLYLINASGTATDTDTVTGFILDLATVIHIGHLGGIRPWAGHLAEFMLFPFAVPVGVWDGIASTMGQTGDGSADAIPLPQWPRKLITGDIGITQPMGSPARLYGRLFEGNVGGVDMIVGDARTNLGAVAFTLGEV